MFKESYRKKFDAILPDADFRVALEERMEEMQNRDNIFSGYNRKMLAALILLMVLLTATAVALVQGNLLHSRIEKNAGEAFANQVQNVHVAGGNDDFSFTVDEILCEGDKMYLSYSVSVPDDGNTYLYALYSPRLNGKKLDASYAYFYDESGMPLIHAIGGELGADRSGVIQDIIIEDAAIANTGNLLDIQAVFFETDRKVQYTGLWEDYNAMMEEHVISENTNGSRDTVQLLPDDDTFYYFGKEAGAEWAAIYLEFHPDYWDNWREMKQDKMHKEVLTPEELSATGIARLVDNVRLSIPLELSDNARTGYNDVAQRIFELEGFSLEITDFQINHLGASYKAEIRSEGEISQEYSGNEPFAQFYALLRSDGSELNNGQGGSVGSGGLSIKKDGSRVYMIDQTINAVIPVEEIDSLLLAPEIFAKDGTFVGYDLENAIQIQPVYNPDKPEATAVPTEDPAITDDLSS